MTGRAKISSHFSFGPTVLNSSDSLSILSPCKVIPLSSLDYNQNNQIGRGGSATVYEGKFSGRDVAVKVYWFDNPSSQSNKKLLLKEAAELLSLQHENIIQCFGVCAEIGGIILELAKKEIVVGGVTQYVHSLKQLIEAIPKEFFSMELRYAFLVHSSLIFYLILQLFFSFQIRGSLSSSERSRLFTQQKNYPRRSQKCECISTGAR